MRLVWHPTAVAMLAAMIAVAAPAAAESAPNKEQTLTPDQTRALALAAHQQHKPELARDLALVLLQRDSNDSVALQVLAASYYALGQFDAAAAAGARAYRAAQNGRDSHDAAMIAAEAQFRRDRIGSARLWLRRAVQFAQTPQDRDMAVRAYQGLGARQKLKTNLSFGFSPSSNINGGSSSDTLVLFGIPFTLSGDARALSGYEADLGASVSYTISESQTHQTVIGANLETRVYKLSKNAKVQAPGAKASDYAFTAVEGFVTYRFGGPTTKGPTGLTLVVGHNWYGGTDLSDYLRGQVARDWQLSPSMGFELSGALERQWRKDSAARSATVQSVTAGLVQALKNGDRVTYSIGLRNTDALSSDTDHRAVYGNLGYNFGHPILGMVLSGSLGFENRDYPLSPYSPNGRQDHRLTAEISALLPKFAYMGFAPEVGLTATRNESNISLYRSSDIGISFNIRSTF